MNEIQVNTTQNVIIDFTAASLGERILAFLFDMILIFSYLTAIFFIAKKIGINSIEDNWAIAAISTIFMLPAMFYTLISEIVMEGQTLGKKVLKIKVIKIDGYQADYFDYFIRWLFRLIDVFLIGGTGAVAILSIAFSKKKQRLGDIASGTAVINIKNISFIKSSILLEVGKDYKAIYPSVINLSDNDIRIIKEMLKISLKTKNRKTLEKLRKKVEEITKTTKGNQSSTKYLKTIIKDYTYFTQDM